MATQATWNNLFVEAVLTNMIKGTALVATTGTTRNSRLNSANCGWSLSKINQNVSGTFLTTSTDLLAYSAGSSVSFSSPVNGVATISVSFTYNANAGVPVQIMVSQNPAVGSDFSPQVACTLSAVGGVTSFVGDVTSFSSGSRTYTGAIKVPLNNNGTLRMNYKLANDMVNAMIFGTGNPAIANGGVLTVYDGAQPADASTAVTTQTAIATRTFATTDFGTAAGRAINVTGTPALTTNGGQTNAVGTWFRWTKTGGYVLDGSVGTADTDLVVDVNDFTSGGTARNITSLAIIWP
jgi:hypothetical protein